MAAKGVDVAKHLRIFNRLKSFQRCQFFSHSFLRLIPSNFISIEAQRTVCGDVPIDARRGRKAILMSTSYLFIYFFTTTSAFVLVRVRKRNVVVATIYQNTRRRQYAFV